MRCKQCLYLQNVIAKQSTCNTDRPQIILFYLANFLAYCSWKGVEFLNSINHKE